MDKITPLVLVFYIDRETLKNKEIFKLFSDSVNDLIETKGFNVLCFFLPTDETERIECINPVLATESQLETINKLITDISTSFGIGDELKIDEINE
jgi:hypothetical protein